MPHQQPTPHLAPQRSADDALTWKCPACGTEWVAATLNRCPVIRDGVHCGAAGEVIAGRRARWLTGVGRSLARLWSEDPEAFRANLATLRRIDVALLALAFADELSPAQRARFRELLRGWVEPAPGEQL